MFRALVGADLKGNSKLQIDAIAIKALENVKRDTMHVQGISYWAPANIGPYSQSVVVSLLDITRFPRFFIFFLGQ